ncbi:MAG: hypothetical protein GX316_01325 [Firmicutes bacterium]|nr:hypothetical protein [Bacillota bacterium]
MRIFRFLIVLSLVLSAASLVSAAYPERVFENPVLLSETAEGPLVYLSYSSDMEHFTASYTEYDEYAEGYGGFIVRHSSVHDETTLTAAVTKQMDGLDVGAAIHWVMGPETAWLLDAGARYKMDALEVHVGVHDIPFTKWNALAGSMHFSAGVSLDLAKYINIGLDARLLENPLYKGSVLFTIQPDLKTEVYTLYESTEWQATGINAWLCRGLFLFRLGYKIDLNGENHFCAGIGMLL